MAAITTAQRPARRSAGAPAGRRKPDERLDALLDAAASLIVDKGIKGTSVDDIAMRAGVAKGTFYHYFESKAAMLESLQRRYSRQLAEAARGAASGKNDGDWETKLSLWINAVVQASIRNAAHDAFFHEPLKNWQPLSNDLAALLSAGREAGRWEVGDSQAIAAFILYGLLGLFAEKIVHGLDIGDVLPEIRILLSRLLAPPNQGEDHC